VAVNAMGRAITGIGLAVLLAACSSSGAGGTGGSGGGPVGAGGVASGGVLGQTGGSGGSATGGVAITSGNGGASAGGAGGGSAGVGAAAATGGTSPASGGNQAGGASGAAGWGAAGTPAPANLLVTSAEGSYWKIGTFTETASGDANVTVDDTATAQTWEGFGGTFNEIGWSLLTSKQMQDQAVQLLFSASDGANFAWGLIPIGATDYAVSRYTLDDTGTDVKPASDEYNRPPADLTLSKFSLDRDGQMLIPYVKAAQVVKRDLRFWASPWTPPVWMKSGYKKDSGTGSGNAAKPSYYDGGKMKSDAATLAAYAQYFVQFIRGYRAQGIDVEVVSPQDEPTFDQNSPSCTWDPTTYTSFVGGYLGPAMKELGVNVILGTFANGNDVGGDLDIAKAALADPAATSFLYVAGVEWGMLDRVNAGTTLGDLPVWVTTHKFGNYPFCSGVNSYCPGAYNATQAPNDHAYGVESWGYIRDAITKGKATMYSAWNMVLDKIGLGNDTSRDWKQDALLVADGGTVKPTPAYYVFRHLSQYVVPGAKVVGTTGGDAVAFKNPDGSIVAVVYNKGAANSAFVVAMAGKKLQLAMPADGWATIKLTP
jgi:glucosylceramidase